MNFNNNCSICIQFEQIYKQYQDVVDSYRQQIIEQTDRLIQFIKTHPTEPFDSIQSELTLVVRTFHFYTTQLYYFQNTLRQHNLDYHNDRKRKRL